MTAATECPHGELVGMPCPPCDRDDTPADVDGPEWSSPFRARYPGNCGGCGFPISEGEWIRGTTVDDHRVYVHDDGGCQDAAEEAT